MQGGNHITTVRSERFAILVLTLQKSLSTWITISLTTVRSAIFIADENMIESKISHTEDNLNANYYYYY